MSYLRGKILFIGNSPILNDIISFINQTHYVPSHNYTVISNYSENPGNVYINGSKSGISLFNLVIDNQYSTVVVSDSFSEFPVLKKQLLSLRLEGIKIYDAPWFYEAITGKVPVNYIKDTWLLFRDEGGTFKALFYLKIKKIIDKSLALLGILFSFPFMVLTAVAIKISTRGLVFYKQERIGQHEKPFALMKFCTIGNNTEKEMAPGRTANNELRITKIGGFLRKSRLDELPRLFNILNGDMSFVGPRLIGKHANDMLAKDIPYYRYRFTVKPGLTGWAQIKGGSGDTKEAQSEKHEYDLYYNQNQSVVFDLFILLKTIQTVLFGKGN